MQRFRSILGVVVAVFCATPGVAQRQMEALGRGLVAVNRGSGQVYLSWRLLGTDPDELAFNVYRAAASPGEPTNVGSPVRLNATPLTQTTDFTDTTADTSLFLSYQVRPVLNGAELPASAPFVLAANAPVRQYLSIPLTPPPGGTTPDGVAYTYNANDCSTGDLDGDGEYELVLKWDPSNSKDNSQSGHTGNVYLDGYKMDGTRLWRIDLGRNIRAGAHYTPFIVYDLDGDGRAEIACKTADGTVDGAGTTLGDGAADFRNASGYVLTGPEYLTIFDGRTGAALATTNYLPPRNLDPGSPDVSAWGDNYGNRVDRFLAAVAYLDGSRPSLVMCRGYYTRTVLVAWNWREGRLTREWTFDSDDGTPGNTAYRGQGNHNLSVADVEDDGRDEIVYGSCTIDDDGRGLYSTAIGHGDALHVTDLDPERPGLEVWQCHEDVATNGGIGLSFRDARTGVTLWTVPNNTDTGRALAMDIDPRYAGAECWGAAGRLYSAQGVEIASRRPSAMNFAVWWDADPLREILDGTTISKWNWNTGTLTPLLQAAGCASNNSTKATPGLSADLLGDWREEVVWRTTDNRELRIYTTVIPATTRMPTLMHDSQYRVAIAWQNVAYNQPPHPSFFVGDGMKKPPVPLIRPAGAAPMLPQLANISVLTRTGTGASTLIAGFSVTGTGSRTMLIRGVGPTLATFKVPDPLADPTLTLFTGSTALAVSNDWSSEPVADDIASTADALGAFPLPRSGRDAVLLPTLSPGTYTAHVGATDAGAGMALVEIYAAGGSPLAHLSNASVRARAGGSAGGPLIVGFVIAGSGTRPVLIRAIGPHLAEFGVSDVVADPQLTLFRGDAVAAANDDWGANSGATPAAFATLGAFPLPAGSKDAALLLNLPPGLYSAHAAGASEGVVMLEVYTTAD
jgi:rhamnogalacturonan endolyase